MKPRSALALAATGLAIGGVATASGPAAGTLPKETQQFTLIEVAKSQHFLDLDKRGAPGDEYLFTSIMYAKEVHGKDRVRVGTDAGVCTLVAKHASQCLITVVINYGDEHGQITGQGTFTDNSGASAFTSITGGSQSFYGATGQAESTDVNKNTTRLRFDLTYPPPEQQP